MSEETALQKFDAAVAKFKPGQAAVEQPADSVAPPPAERERPLGKWNIPWEKFQQNLGEFGPAVKENFINIVKSGGSKRWSRDFWMIANAALLEIPVIGPIASLTSMVGQTGLLVRNEVKKAKFLGKEEYLNRSALKQAGEAMFKVAFKREGKRTAVGKRERAGGQTEDLVLTNTEAAIAGVFGVGSSLAAIAILEDISLINFIPGMKAAKRLYLAPLLTMLISSGFGALGESYFDVFKRSDKVKDEKLFQQKKAQFVEMVLAVNAPVMQIMTTMGIITSLAEKAGEYRAAHPKAEVTPAPQAEKTPTPTETAAVTAVAATVTGTPTLVPSFEHTPTPPPASTQLPGNYSGDEPWKDMAKHHFDAPVMPPSETPPPAEMPTWQPGQTVDSNLLQKAFDSGVKHDEIQVNIDNDPELETVYRFNLDSDLQPEVWAVKDNNGVWHPWIWEDKGGLYKGDLNLDGQTDQGSLSLKDLEDNHLLLSWQGSGGERGPLNLEMKDYDLDDDGNDDLLNDANGWYLDRNKDFAFGEGDVRLREEPVFNSGGNVAKLEAVDGQKWWRDSEDKMTGLIKNAANQWFIDREAKVLAPDIQDNISVSGTGVTETSLIAIGSEENPQFRVEFKNAEVVFNDGGKWIFDGGGEPIGTLADGRNLHLDSAGETGIWAIQHALAVAHPDWSPDEVGKAAFLAPADTTRSSILNIHKPEPYHAVAGGDGGFWATNDQGQVVGVLGDGRTLSQDSRGGWDGVVQGGIINQASPQSNGLSPLQVGIISHQAVSTPEFSGSPQSGSFSQLSQSQQQAVFQVYNNQMAHYSLEKAAADYFSTNELGYSSRAAVNVYLQDYPLMPVNTGFSAGSMGRNFLDNFGIDPDEFERWLREEYHGQS